MFIIIFLSRKSSKTLSSWRQMF